MAGRPVSVSSGQSTMLYWVIVFAILMMASLGLFIFQLTNNKRLENDAQRATRDVNAFGRPPQYYSDEARNRNTNVFAVMTDNLKKVSGVVTGVPEDVGPMVVAKAEQAVKDIADRKPGAIGATDTLLVALAKLDGLHTDERDQAAAAQGRLRDLEAEKAALTEQLKSTRDAFEGQVATLREQLQQVEEEKTKSLGQKDEQLRDLQATLDAREQQLQKLKREGNAVVRDKDVEIGRLETVVGTLQEQIKSLKPSTFDPNAILTKADGRILRAVPGSDVVYVNLGAADKVKVGMGFEIYSQTREGSGGLRGKASMEVATVMEDTAECRVTRRTPGQPIIAGDYVVNIAYERNRKPKFVVQGEFDLDYDGIPDPDGVEQVANLIRQWGGQVVEELDQSVDFVVVGQSPGGPKFADDTILTDVVRDQARRKELAGFQFVQLLDRAASMYVPVITQNQFLFLTGYAGEGTIVRR